MNKSLSQYKIIISQPLIKWWSYRDLVWNLVSKEIKVRYQGAALGFAWSLMNPLLITLMYLIVFTYVFPSNQKNHALFMVVGIIHWNLFSMSMMQSSELLVGNAELLKKIYFPRILVPLSNLLVNTTLWLMALGVMLALYSWLGGTWQLNLLLYPFYLILWLGFMFGIMLAFCVLYVDFRDLKHIVEAFIQLLFWATPILYPVSKISNPTYHLLIKNDPLAEFAIIFQNFFWANQIPSLELTLKFIIWTFISLSVGFFLFYQRGYKLIERL